MPAKKIQGEIVSLKQPHTAVIKVTVLKTHSKYHKKYKVSKRYHARLPEGSWELGDIVEIAETRPLTRTIRWQVTVKVK
ncbi:MAG: 30S ribosomal protein S17 [Candidatus Doudnabacteria bacterium RIFCSPHIGHO2_01_52_17]|uniref:30S ribosomal protein S17 n=1 Tax=Candidatus Doudnabacteria bacterium RIFCSPHIGHO2_01_52_17 TaxID=1817820 RepID=A0A1F5N8A4_9BACT|nr:ribosomal protein S17 [uncultured bacterium]KKW29782.1 MAG: 30S ribosomal protein S17 [Parcubacteria group bacterium GW2011_GWA2_52_8]OGE73921.1 MAG: 30S ribosomal protein S17 [Candidatus Doudnabacteria bacterium RIFCSPHIGHO2_01_52_17]